MVCKKCKCCRIVEQPITDKQVIRKMILDTYIDNPISVWELDQLIEDEKKSKVSKPKKC